MSRRGRTREPFRKGRPVQAEPSQGAKSPSPLWQEAGLKLLVFSAGGVLMGLEIAGSRVLAPHFGNSVFVWGSLISVFLVALSVGYFFGGRVADRYPSRAVLNSICVLVSLAIFAVAVIARGLCGGLVDAGLGERSGPLVASLLLFLPPSVGMGMVSPFAVRLATRSVSSVGRISGTLYALSTGGSIAGTLLTTFVLIPLIGVSTILQGLGLFLLLVSLLTFPFRRRGRALVGAAGMGLLALICVLAPGSRAAAFLPFDEIILDVDTPYHHVSVIDNQDARRLRFDSHLEGAISKSPPYPSLVAYTTYFHLAFLVRPEIKRTLFIGAGGGIGPREFHMHAPRMAIDVVDIDPQVLELARTHFFLEESPQIKTFAEDGRMFLRKAPDKYDCIVLDAFSAAGRIPFHLVTREFLALCRDKMTADGVFLMNVNSAIDGPLSQIFRSMVRTIESAFPHTYVFVVHRRQSSPETAMNIILLAIRNKEPIPPPQWSARAGRHRSNSYVKDVQVGQMVEDLLIDLPDVARSPIFSDDYAPIETMPF
jgi:spermidine synthase